MSEVAIQIIGPVIGGTSPFDGQWLVEYDPTRPGTGPAGEPMTAHIVCSPDRSQARRFADAVEAHGYWRTESGRPYPEDRPLTAFSVVIEPADGPCRNGEGAPYWANGTEILLRRTMIKHHRPEVTDAELNALPYAELERLYREATRPQ